MLLWRSSGSYHRLPAWAIVCAPIAKRQAWKTEQPHIFTKRQRFPASGTLVIGAAAALVDFTANAPQTLSLGRKLYSVTESRQIHTYFIRKHHLFVAFLMPTDAAHDAPLHRNHSHLHWSIVRRFLTGDYKRNLRSLVSWSVTFLVGAVTSCSHFALHHVFDVLTNETFLTINLGIFNCKCWRLLNNTILRLLLSLQIAAPFLITSVSAFSEGHLRQSIINLSVDSSTSHFMFVFGCKAAPKFNYTDGHSCTFLPELHFWSSKWWCLR